MSVEALWAVQFTGVNGARIAKSGGVLVVETGRVFGGDTWQWYTGRYERIGERQYSIQLETGTHFTEGGISIFGGPLRPQKYTGSIQVAEDQQSMSANLAVVGHPEMVLTVALKRVAELP
jgi:hypothetical protein